MQQFLEVHRGEHKYRVNPEHVSWVEAITDGDPKSGCYLHLVNNDTVTVDETFRTLNGRLNRLATNNTNLNTNDNEDV